MTEGSEEGLWQKDELKEISESGKNRLFSILPEGV